MRISTWFKRMFCLTIAAIAAYVVGLVVIAGRPQDVATIIAVIASLLLIGWALKSARRRRTRLRVADQILQQLEQAILLNLPLPRAMAALAADRPGKAGAELRAIPVDLAAGLPLGSVLARHTVLPSNTIAAINAAELAGQLDHVIPALAAARRKAVESRVRSGDFYRQYSLVVLIALLGVIELIRTFVGPRFAQIFRDFHQPLPWITRMTLRLGGPGGDSILLLSIVFLVALWISRVVTTGIGGPTITRRFDGLLGWLPKLNRARHDASLADAFTFLADALADDRQLPASLQMAAQLSGDRAVRKALHRVHQDLARGVSIDQASRNGGLPNLLTELISRERGANGLIHALRFAADHYRNRAKRSQAWFELMFAPTAALSLGLLVGWVALAVMLPIVQLTDLTNARALVVR